MGLPLSVPSVINRVTGLAQGVAVPEADRDKNLDPIYFVKKAAIPGIPLIDSNGEEIVDEGLSGRFNNIKLQAVINSYDGLDSAQKLVD